MKKLSLFLSLCLISVLGFSQQNVGIGTNVPGTKLDVNGAIALREGQALTLANGGASGGTNDNIILPDIAGATATKASFYRIVGPTAAFSIYGIAPVTGADGEIVTLINTTSNVVTVKNNASSTSANSILTLTGGDIASLAATSAITLQYNKTAGKWYVTSTQNFAVSAGSIATSSIVQGSNAAVSITNGSNQVVGSGNVVIDVATNALATKGVVPGPTGGNSNDVWGTDGSGNPAWEKVSNSMLSNSSITVTGGTGISVSGSPVALGGTVTITNSAPNQTVYIGSGTGISVSGSYPNFTVTNTSPSSGGTVTGTGTSNYLARWTGTSTLGTGASYDNGTALSIGTTATPATLNVNGPSVIGTGLTSRSALGLTISTSSATTYAANADVGDGSRQFSVVNEGSTANSMAILSMRSNTGGGANNQMLDMKLVNPNDGTSKLIYSFGPAVNFTDRFTFTSAGNLGIGTTTPGGPLDINGRASASSFKVSSSFTDLTNNSPWYGIGMSNVTLTGQGSTAVQVGGFYGITFAESGATRMTINLGNVGIGTVSPAQLLDVNGVINSASGFRYNNTNYTAGNYLRSNGTNFVPSTIQAGDVSGLITANNGLTMSTGTNVQLGGTLAGATTLTTASTGNNLTINSTVAASTTLNAETVGNLVINRSNAGGTGGELTIRNAGGSGTVNSSAVIGFETDGSTAFGSDGSIASNAEIRATNTNTSNGADLIFSNWSGTAENERMRITAGGNVGIGTSAPGYPVQISGTSGDGVPTLLVQSTASPTSWNSPFQVMTPNLQNGGKNMFAFGKAYASGQTGYMYYYYGSSGSTTNSIRFGFYGVDDLLNITAAGTVGIGTTTPAYALDVNGYIRGNQEVIATMNSGNYGQFRAVSGNYGYFLRNDGSNTYMLLTASGNQYGVWNSLRPMYISDATGDVSMANGGIFMQHSTGYLGIGTSGPGYSLDVAGKVGIDGANDGAIYINGTKNTYHGIEWNYGSNDRYGISQSTGGNTALYTSAAYGPSFISFNLANAYTSAFTELARITHAGYMGIGTTSPRCPLDVESTNGSFNQGSYYYLAGSGSSTASCSACNVSIYTPNRMEAAEFDAFSDKRIKKDITAQTSSTSLDKANQLNVVTFHYIDQIQKGTKNKTGFIAQEVEGVLPNAVNQDIGFIPNVFQVPEKAELNGKSLNLATAKAHEFSVGDEIRIYDNDNHPHDVKVSAVKGANEFTVSDWTGTSDSLFVYGKKVDDYRNIDFDQLTAVSIGAVQELDKKIKALEQENAKLNAVVKEKDAAIKAAMQQKANTNDVNQLKAQLDELKTLMEKNGIRTEK